MEDFRSKSYNGNRMQIEPYNTHNPSNFQDFRCHSASYASSSQTQIENTNNPTAMEFKKGKSGSISRIWSLTDPEMQRKKRIASYKAYTVEGKIMTIFDSIRLYGLVPQAGQVVSWYLSIEAGVKKFAKNKVESN
ncbi:hypothetical protein LXL04_002403 [Taraxacum kok-saghyz]